LGKLEERGGGRIHCLVLLRAHEVFCPWRKKRKKEKKVKEIGGDGKKKVRGRKEFD